MPFGYAGGMRDDATGHVHFGAREYDPWLGRWISKDPILFAGGDANLYAYVGGDPANFVDPTGLAFHDPLVDWVSGQSVSDRLAGAGDAGLQFVYDTAHLGVRSMMPWPARSFVPGRDLDVGDALRSLLGIDDQVDQCSEAYGNGHAFGTAAAVVGSLMAGGGGAMARPPDSATVIISRWGRPGLQAGDWVMMGRASRLNYILTFKWQPGMGNRYAAFNTGQEFAVLRSQLTRPRRWFGIDGRWKSYFFGQWIYRP